MNQRKSEEHAGREDLGRELFALYNRRHFSLEALLKAKQLLLRFYEHSFVRKREPLPHEYRFLSTSAELVDYSNAMDADLGVPKYPPGEVYRWIRSTAEKVLKELDSLDQQGGLYPDTSEKAERWIYQLRLSAAGFANELYRDSMYFESLVQFDRLIEMGEHLLCNIQSAQRSQEGLGRRRFEEHVLEAKDMLCYLNFSAGKAARQNGDSLRADIYFEKSSDYLLQSALALTGITDARLPDPDRMELAHYKLTRIGVVEVARAWNFVVQGTMEAAASSARRAMDLVAGTDKQNKMLAQSILGIVERTKAGKDRKALNAAIAKLKESYAFFLEEMPTPRYAVRCLCELEIAYVIAGELNEALNNLKQFAEYLKPGHPRVFRFEKITRQPRWSGQLRLVKSRIARKAAEKLGTEDLSVFITALDEILAHSRPRRTGTPEAQALQLALEEAEDVESCSDRGVRMDAMVCRGEALMAMGKEDSAKKIFLRLLHENGVGSDAGLGRAADREQFQAELRKVKEEPHVVALPIIYLAQVAMTHWELDLADFYLEQSKTLLRPEHAWLETMWQKTQTRFRNVVEDKLVVDLKNHRGLRDLETRFRASLEKKFQLLSRPINDLKEEFHTDDYTIKRLRKKIRQDKGIKRIRRPKRKRGKKPDHLN